MFKKYICKLCKVMTVKRMTTWLKKRTSNIHEYPRITYVLSSHVDLIVGSAPNDNHHHLSFERTLRQVQTYKIGT